MSTATNKAAVAAASLLLALAGCRQNEPATGSRMTSPEFLEAVRFDVPLPTDCKLAPTLLNSILAPDGTIYLSHVHEGLPIVSRITPDGRFEHNWALPENRPMRQMFVSNDSALLVTMDGVNGSATQLFRFDPDGTPREIFRDVLNTRFGRGPDGTMVAYRPTPGTRPVELFFLSDDGKKIRDITDAAVDGTIWRMEVGRDGTAFLLYMVRNAPSGEHRIARIPRDGPAVVDWARIKSGYIDLDSRSTVFSFRNRLLGEDHDTLYRIAAAGVTETFPVTAPAALGPFKVDARDHIIVSGLQRQDSRAVVYQVSPDGKLAMPVWIAPEGRPVGVYPTVLANDTGLSILVSEKSGTTTACSLYRLKYRA